MSSLLAPFQLLEVNIISAQDVSQVTRHMRSYAIAWVHNDRKLYTRVDNDGHNNPTWNDKFVFRVDDHFLRSDTSAVMVEIYARSWFRDIHVGTVRVLVGNLIPLPTKPYHPNHHLGMRFAALQVRRKSGRPQGILNIGVALLDSSMRSMPLYTQTGSSAVGYRDLMGEEDPHGHLPPHYNTGAAVIAKPVLRRTFSDRSELERKPALEEEFSQKGSMFNNCSDMTTTKVKKSRSKPKSMISGSSFGAPIREKYRAYSSKPGSMVNGSDIFDVPMKMNKNVNTMGIYVDTVKKMAKIENPNSAINNGSEVIDPSPKKNVQEAVVKEKTFASLMTMPKPSSKFATYEPNKGQQKYNIYKRKSILSESVGPSPSELAGTTEEVSSSVMEGWSLDESIEGLRSKLERWRTELPPVYDRGDLDSFQSSLVGGGGGAGGGTGLVRRHIDGGATGGGGGEGGGLFSCFGNIYGYECSCVCGKPTPASKGSSHGGGRVHLTPSADSLNRSYM